MPKRALRPIWFGGFGFDYFHGRVRTFTSPSAIDLEDLSGAPFDPSGGGIELLMFVGDWGEVRAFDKEELTNFFPYLAEKRSYQVAMWFKGTADVGNILTCDLFGTAYASSRAL